MSSMLRCLSCKNSHRYDICLIWSCFCVFFLQPRFQQFVSCYRQFATCMLKMHCSFLSEPSLAHHLWLTCWLLCLIYVSLWPRGHRQQVSAAASLLCACWGYTLQFLVPKLTPTRYLPKSVTGVFYCVFPITTRAFIGGEFSSQLMSGVLLAQDALLHFLAQSLARTPVVPNFVLFCYVLHFFSWRHGASTDRKCCS